jgi:hypothetical protein
VLGLARGGAPGARVSRSDSKAAGRISGSSTSYTVSQKPEIDEQDLAFGSRCSEVVMVESKWYRRSVDGNLVINKQEQISTRRKHSFQIPRIK